MSLLRHGGETCPDSWMVRDGAPVPSLPLARYSASALSHLPISFDGWRLASHCWVNAHGSAIGLPCPWPPDREPPWHVSDKIKGPWWNVWDSEMLSSGSRYLCGSSCKSCILRLGWKQRAGPSGPGFHLFLLHEHLQDKDALYSLLCPLWPCLTLTGRKAEQVTLSVQWTLVSHWTLLDWKEKWTESLLPWWKVEGKQFAPPPPPLTQCCPLCQPRERPGHGSSGATMASPKGPLPCTLLA